MHLEVLILETFILVLLEGGTENHRKILIHWKNINQKYYSSDYYDASVNKYSVKCGALLRFWENKGWINEIDPYGWFQWYLRYWLSRRSEDDERKVNRWIKTIGRFRGKLVKMIEGAGSKFDDYSISPKIRQILLHSGLWINWVITSLTDKESYKKQKKDILKKKLLTIINKTKK